jgi:hypothetical protein
MHDASTSPLPATTRQPCAAIRRDGQPCAAPALPRSPFCFAHDPERAEQRTAARSRGGHNRANVVRLRGLAPARLLPIYDRLERALAEVHDGTLEPPRASAMAALARAMATLLTAGELEQRLRDLEALTPIDAG